MYLFKNDEKYDAKYFNFIIVIIHEKILPPVESNVATPHPTAAKLWGIIIKINSNYIFVKYIEAVQQLIINTKSA